MTQRFLIPLATLLLLSATLAAADTLTVEQKLRSEYVRPATLRNRVWQNTAIRYDLRPFSLTDVSVKGMYEQRGNAALAQEGNGQKHFSVEVNSFLVLNRNSRLFGQASYRNGRTENVRWNESSDYSVLYPYVVGDSIGGFMKEEEYKFSGGYARRFGAWTAGAELDYRAVIAYRDKDPRPRNVVSDLQASAALSRLLNGSYHLGLAMRVRKYNQKGEINFLADKGATPVYQMTGLGMDYVRFAGVQTSTRYTGTGIGGSIDLLPDRRQGENNGFSASLRADYLHLTKELPYLNHAPINEIKNVDLLFEGAWIRQTREWQYGLSLLAAWQHRTGVENIFGEPSGNIYPKLSSVEHFGNNTLRTELKGSMGRMPNSSRRWGWKLLPGVEYGQTHPEYKGNGRYAEIAFAGGGLEAQSLWQMSKLLLSASLTGGYAANVKSEQALPGVEGRKSVEATLLSNLRYLSDDCASAALKVRADYVVNTQYAVSLAARWQHREYKRCGGTDRVEVSLGVTF